jgi:hypothetical protein
MSKGSANCSRCMFAPNALQRVIWRVSLRVGILQPYSIASSRFVKR